MVKQEYWSAVEEKGLRKNEITCAWFLVLAAVVVLQIVTSLAQKPACRAETRAAIEDTKTDKIVPTGEDRRVLAAASHSPCGKR
jgi:hypothetical protein